MFQTLRRRFGVLGLTIASLWPNASKISFMGSRDVKTVVATVEEATAKAEPAIEKAVQAASGGTGRAATAAAAGGGIVAIGAAERGCVSGVEHAGQAATDLGKVGASGLSHGAEDLAAARSSLSHGVDGLGRVELPSPTTELPHGASSSAAEDVFAERSSLPGSRPLPGRAAVWSGVPQLRVESAAKTAIDHAGLIISSTEGSADSLEVFELRQTLENRTLRMTEDLLLRLSPADLTPETVARTFNSGISQSYHASLNVRTGMVEIHLGRNGVVLTAEFNLYKAAAAGTAALANPLQDLEQRSGGRGSGSGGDL